MYGRFLGILKDFAGEDWQALKLLFEYDDSNEINIALHRAAQMGSVFLIKRLLLDGAHANYVNEKNGRPLDVALCQGKDQAVRELASRGAFVENNYYSGRDRKVFREAFEITRHREQEVYRLLRSKGLSDQLSEVVLSFALYAPYTKPFYHIDCTVSDDEKYSESDTVSSSSFTSSWSSSCSVRRTSIGSTSSGPI